MAQNQTKERSHSFDMKVDAAGSLKPLDSGAREDLLSRIGRYRLLPSAQQMLLLHQVGDEPGANGQAIRLAGQITSPGALCDIFAMVAQLGWRGALVVCDRTSQRTLYFEEGSVCGGGTSVLEERLGAVMFRYGVIDEGQRAQIATASAAGGRFGELAVELGVVGQEDIYRCLRQQIEDITFAAFTLSEGTFCFLDGFDATRLASHQRVPAQGLLMDGVTRMDEIRFFREKIPSDAYVPSRTSLTSEPAEEYRTTYAAVNGRLTVGMLGRVTGRGEFGATKDVFGLERSGHLVIEAPRVDITVEELVQVTNRVLRIVFGAVSEEGKSELRESLASFAAGAGVYNPIFHGAGPDTDGSFSPAGISRNWTRLETAQDERILQKMLYEYVSFAIFCVGAAIGWQGEVALSESVEFSISILKP